MNAQRIEEVARLCHEVNRAWCQIQGDDSQVPWEEAPQWQRESALAGVVAQVNNKLTPRQQHEAWCDAKHADGWVYGPDKDPQAKTHPCLVPYERLPPAQRAKDHLFVAVVRAYLFEQDR